MAHSVPQSLRRAFTCTADAVFVVDDEFRVLFANDGFLELIERPLHEIQGKLCSEVIRGCRLNGEPLCGSICPVSRRLRSQELVESFDMAVPSSSGEVVWYNVGCMHAHPSWAPAAVVFFIRPVRLARLIERMSQGAGRGPAPEPDNGASSRLTRRELTVLEMLGRGEQTQEIATDLGISQATVRNHVRNILGKLGVHTRVEAVAYAFRQGLITKT